MRNINGCHLRTIEVLPWPERLDTVFPFTVPVVRSIHSLEFSTPVTILVGENGTGKSTILEAVACAAEMITVGSESVTRDPGLSAARDLARYIRLVWTKRTRKGFFLRAEDFYGYARKMAAVRVELEHDLHAAQEETRDRSILAQQMAAMPYRSQLGEIKRRYGEGLDHRSHGESFLLLFQERFVPGGLYLLDEPETPLSPVRQLALLAILREMVSQEAQFILATHSPILMAYPGAQIFTLDEGKPKPAKYEDLDHVRLTRDFLNNPEAFLRRLGEDHEG
jgi:predicted ATPase